MSNRGSKKKRKSSEFSAQDDGHIKSGPAVKVWSHEGFILTSKITRNRPMGQVEGAVKSVFFGKEQSNSTFSE